ncbi:hypothetical protein Btru_002303 [Bulinus truncatus]|nr:hypothetical protein Btru_002303 [Bulinus truncatus]
MTAIDECGRKFQQLLAYTPTNQEGIIHRQPRQAVMKDKIKGLNLRHQGLNPQASGLYPQAPGFELSGHQGLNPQASRFELREIKAPTTVRPVQQTGLTTVGPVDRQAYRQSGPSTDWPNDSQARRQAGLPTVRPATSQAQLCKDNLSNRQELPGRK